MTTPDVTVIMPLKAYTPRYLTESIGSLINQTSDRWRLVVVDDGAEHLDAYFAVVDDPRISVVGNAGAGIAAAINTGIRVASTEFVALLFGDDLLSPDAVEVLDRCARQHPDIDFFHSSRQYVDGDLTPLSAVYEASKTVALDAFPSGSPVRHLMCFRRELALRIGGVDESLPPFGPDDWDFPWCMAEHGARFMAVKECLYLYRDHRDHYRLTTHVPRSVQVRALRGLLRKHNVDRRRIRREVRDAKRRYLKQSLYRSRVDRWLKQRLGHDPQRGWREPYITGESV